MLFVVNFAHSIRYSMYSLIIAEKFRLIFPLKQEEVGKYDKILEDAYVAAKKETVTRNSDWLDSPWPGFFVAKDMMTLTPTGIKEDMIRHITTKFSEIPPDPDFTLHGGKPRNSIK